MNNITNSTEVQNNTIKIDSGFSNFLAAAKDIVSSSLYKASFIDAPVSVALGAENPFYGPSAAFGAYNIRSTTNKFLKENLGISKEDTAGNVAVGVLAGSLGGSFKYSLTGQNPVVGAVNHALYETCNNFKACGESLEVSRIFTIVTETLDALAQVYLAATARSADDAGKKMAAFKAAAFGGFMAGSAVVASVDFIYLPIVDFIKFMGQQEEISIAKENFENITGLNSSFVEDIPDL